MGLETSDPNSRPDVLNAAWPLANDPLNRGDDHLRLLKVVLKNFHTDIWEDELTRENVKKEIIPPAVNSAVAGSGFGGFRYEVVDVAGEKILRLYTT